MTYKLYEVGGRIRDFYLGLESKDVDYTVVIKDPLSYDTPLDAFNAFKEEIIGGGFEVFLASPETFTIRAKFPSAHQHNGIADFVLARKEGNYLDNTRTPVVSLGTLEDDLARRDFTVNAMARGENGDIIDLFGGRADLVKGIIRTPKDAIESFNNDPLRILRALRFYVTKDLGFSDEVLNAIILFKTPRMRVVSEERVREEFLKMFKHDTRTTLKILSFLEHLNPKLYDHLVGTFWLIPTNKKQF